jgi:hypothetical protein
MRIPLFVAAWLLAGVMAISYRPMANTELYKYFESDLADMCSRHSLQLDISRYVDNLPYTGIAPNSVPFVSITPASGVDTARTVLITCGTGARDLFTTDVCVHYVKYVCSGKAPLASTTHYVILPYVNERGRELVFFMWPEFRGSYLRSYGQLLLDIPEYLRRTARELLDGVGTVTKSEDFPRVQCFDGSVKLTRLANNWPTGWRVAGNVIDPSDPLFMRNTASLSPLSADLTSINGRMPFSDPETRIIDWIVRTMSPETVIEVTMGVPAVLAPVEAPDISMELNRADPNVQQNVLASAQRAVQVAKSACPFDTCLGGSAADVRHANGIPHRTGTLPDYAIYYGVPRAYAVQVLALNTTINADTLPDCLFPFMPASQEQAETLADKWAVLIDKLTVIKTA